MTSTSAQSQSVELEPQEWQQVITALAMNNLMIRINYYA